MELRPYQKEAVNSVFNEWQNHKSTLIVMPTGLGKTVVFSEITNKLVKNNAKVLILAHREDLLIQAIDKLSKFGINSSLEKAECHAVNTENVVVASVQTLGRSERLSEYPRDYFSYIIIDEAHHSVTQNYTNIIEYFCLAKVLGVTATPNRSDMRALSNLYETVAFRMDIMEAINDGWLSTIKTRKCPVNIDLSSVRTSCGDFNAGDLENVLYPYLKKISDTINDYAKNRKILVFTPTISIAEKFSTILNQEGFKAAAISSKNTAKERDDIRQQLHDGDLNIVCNAMLWTEGFDEPSVDCIINLRATKSASLYTQIIGRGLRLYENKENLLILDFLWQSSNKKLDILSPQKLFFDQDDIPYIEKHLKDGKEYDLFEIGSISHEENLADKLQNAKKHFFKGIPIKELKEPKMKYYYNDDQLDSIIIENCEFCNFIFHKNKFEWFPVIKWEVEPMTDKQKEYIKNILGKEAKYIQYKGQANQIISEYAKRFDKGLCSAKQYNLLKKRGFQNVEKWTRDDAAEVINLLVKYHWQVPYFIKADTYIPLSQRKNK